MATIRTIANGIDTEMLALAGTDAREVARRRLGLGPGELVIGSIGRLVEVKGVTYLLSAFARLIRSRVADVRLVLVGDGPLLRDLQGQAVRDGTASQVVFAGFRDDVTDLLPAFDVIAFSSISEGLPMTLLEAMAAERCIVGTAGGLTDVLVDERDALIVPTRDAERLASAPAPLVGGAAFSRARGVRFTKNTPPCFSV